MAVSIVDGHNNVALATSDPFGVSPVTLPAYVKGRTLYYLPGRGPWTVTLVGSGGVSTLYRTLPLEANQVATLTLPSPPSVAAPVVTDGVTDNYPILNEILSNGAVQTVQMPDTGWAAISNTLILQQGQALAWPTHGPDFQTNAEIVSVRGGLVANAGFTGDSTGALVHMVGGGTPSAQGQCALFGGFIQAGGHAASAVYLDSTECNILGSCLAGGTTVTLGSSTNATRTRLSLCHINNIKNGSAGNATAYAIQQNGADWVCTGVVKKGGSLIVAGSDSVWTGGHLTGGTPNLPTYPGANVVLQAEAQFTGLAIDSCSNSDYVSGGAGMIWVDMAAAQAPSRFTGVKFLSSTVIYPYAVFYHANANDGPIIVDGATLIDAFSTGRGFSALINNVVPGDIWGGSTYMDLHSFTANGTTDATPHISTIWVEGSGSTAAPFGNGTFIYNDVTVAP